MVIESNPPDGQCPAAWPIQVGTAQLGPCQGRFVTALPPFIPLRS